MQQHCVAGTGVRLGIGDDAALTTVAEGCDLVTATDALVEGTHFLPGSSPRSLGHRCLAVNLSDLSAMGAKSRWATLTMALPRVDEAWVTEFAQGFAGLAEQHDVALIGGDTVRGPLHVSVTLMGEVPSGTAVTRAGAAAGDALYVTGWPGHAGAGCALLSGKLECETGADYIRHFEYPQPRVELGQALRGIASAMIDMSDGLATDLGRLLEASGVGAACEIPPLHDLERDFGKARATQLFLQGGEDYELIFTVPAAVENQIANLARKVGCQVVRLGTITDDAGTRWSNLDAEPPVTDSYTHFSDAVGTKGQDGAT